jgi:hypothetical protein
MQKIYQKMNCKKLAANKIFINKSTILSNHYINVVDGEVRSVLPMIVEGVEMFGVEYYDGVMTAGIDLHQLAETQSIIDSIKADLISGYKGSIYLLQHVDIEQMKVQTNTSITEFII